MEEEVKKEIIKNIKCYRKKNKITQTELAQLLNLTVSAVSQWENGLTFPDFEKIYDLCKILKISVDDLLGSYKIGEYLTPAEKEKIKEIKKIINDLKI